MSAAPRAAGPGRADTTRALTEAALVGVTVAAVLGLSRLFADASFLGPVLTAALAAHGLALLCRNRGWGVALSAVVSTVGLGLTVSWLLYPETTTLGFPSWATREAAGADLRAAWETYFDVVAPVPVETGFVLASVLSVWTFAFAADWAAFRLSASIEAVIPSATVFVFGSILSADRHRVVASGLYLGAVLAFLLLHRIMRQQAAASWLTSDARGGRQALLRSGAWLGGIGVVVGLVAGPLLPGVDEPALVGWRGGGDSGEGSRVTISPLVTIQGRLADQSDVEVFTVRTDTRAYWRLTSLERFDGRIWSSQGSYRSAGGELPEGVPSRAETDQVVQEFEITALAMIWLPAAFEPRRIEGGDRVRYDPTSASLLTENETADGLTYQVASALPRFKAEELRTAEGPVPDDIAEEFLDLPADFPAEVTNLAQVITGSDTSTYDRAIALQEYFRNNFIYDLDVGRGHGEDAIQQFLRDKRGYCEQFAGTYAAMARSIGLPARVAVGFTPGIQDSADPELYRVRGQNAHAWPEVYLAGYGWVPFEPTPNRGIPNAEGYTRVPEQQAAPDDNEGVSTTASTTATTVAGGTGTTRPRDPFGEEDVGAGGLVDPEEDKPSPVVEVAKKGSIGLLALAAVWLPGVPLLWWFVSWRRRRAATTPQERVRVAWIEAAESLALAGVPPRPSETFREYAIRAAASTGADRRRLLALAADAEAAAFAPSPVAVEVADRADAAAGATVEQLRRRATLTDRIRWALDPRPRIPRKRSHVMVNPRARRA